MKKFLQMNKMLILMLWVTAVILAACTSPETSSNPAVIEVPVSVSTPEPT
ncbi:MAG: hypothetical protein IAF02_25430, partial [Anaerolineae bacterium]|nr:hypothetical protein [Anaerolineae bacterium]